MSLITPEKIRALRRKLYCKAKAEPDFRFYQLYDKVWRADILEHAWKLTRANRGAPGVDGVLIEQIEAQGEESWLAGLQEELKGKTYCPQAVRRVMTPTERGKWNRQEYEWWQAQSTRRTARRRDQSIDGKLLHQPLSKTLAPAKV